MNFHFEFSTVINSLCAVIGTLFVGSAYKMISNYFKRSERTQELHAIKLDAILYAIAGSSDMVSSEKFKRLYAEHVEQLMEESKLLNQDK